MIFYPQGDARQLKRSMIGNGSPGTLIADDFKPADTFVGVADKFLPLFHDVFFQDLRRMISGDYKKIGRNAAVHHRFGQAKD